MNYLSLNDPFTLTLFALAAVLMAGFLVGRTVNKRRMSAAVHRLEGGLRMAGHDWTVRRLRGGAVRLQLTDTRRPFDAEIKTLTVTLVLISREVLTTWVWEALDKNKRGDLMALHATFKKDPALELEVVNPAHEMGRTGLKQAEGLGWQAHDAGDGWLVCFGGEKRPGVDRVVGRVKSSGYEIWRLALRGTPPHLLINAPLPADDSADVKGLVRLVLEVAGAASGSPGRKKS